MIMMMAKRVYIARHRDIDVNPQLVALPDERGRGVIGLSLELALCIVKDSRCAVSAVTLQLPV